MAMNYHEQSKPNTEPEQDKPIFVARVLGVRNNTRIFAQRTDWVRLEVSPNIHSGVQNSYDV